MAHPADAEAERRLVECCLAGDAAARNQLVREYQGDLLHGIRQHLQQARQSTGEAEDIAEQFWLSQLTNGYSGLRAFDPEHCTLAQHMYRLGWQQVWRWLRRRKPREVYVRPAALDARTDPQAAVWPEGVVVEEFLTRLPPQLREFCHYLHGDPTSFRRSDHSAVSMRVLKHRLLARWDDFQSSAE